MKVDQIVRSKGDHVETIAPTARVGEAAVRMSTQRIGCLVVTTADRAVLGLVTERDLVRALAHRGGDTARLEVRDVMSTNVPVCTRDDDVTVLMRTMTTRRYRHVPLVENGVLAGIVSIGDVVKQRLEDLELETVVLRDAYRATR